jgi:hypothetical protein
LVPEEPFCGFGNGGHVDRGGAEAEGLLLHGTGAQLHIRSKQKLHRLLQKAGTSLPAPADLLNQAILEMFGREDNPPATGECSMAGVQKIRPATRVESGGFYCNTARRITW